ncbi:protein-export chaperone SecB [Acuticoccus mangrovi]|uniref:Protein-export protein SecB n=1 Tax=Acuticoccus mangrovi TaxID=2796142 RepID=A0A934ITM5_9HYPH|nr:protein-export chaperone SecB [Acuticoccus mangrovi]MBJ3777810.1 protein-export chaperone SecB [Acuticoccus mangrovi]
MSDSTTTDTQPSGQPAQPTVRVLAQYVKDFSFENPRAPLSLQRKEGTPPINISVNVNARPLSEQDFEVTLTLEAKAADDNEIAFQVELHYSGILRVAGMKPEHVQPFLLIEGPRLLFPFARQIVADAVRNGGFPPLMIDPIDFVTLYRRNLEKAQASQTNANPIN